MRWVLLVLVLAGCQDHLCDGAEPYCKDNFIHSCNDQHDNMQWETTPCDQQEVCVESGGQAFCASEPTPRASCSGVAPGTRICDGAQPVTCLSGGFAKAGQTCSAPELCQPDLLYFGCTVLPGPQPECMARMASPGPIVWPASYCAGGMQIRCEGPYAVMATSCGQEQCTQSSQYAGCTPATTDPLCTDPNAPYPYARCRGNTTIECLGMRVLTDFTHDCGAGVCVASGGCQG
jgi:hypothetical protein